MREEKSRHTDEDGGGLDEKVVQFSPIQLQRHRHARQSEAKAQTRTRTQTRFGFVSRV